MCYYSRMIWLVMDMMISVIWVNHVRGQDKDGVWGILSGWEYDTISPGRGSTIGINDSRDTGSRPGNLPRVVAPVRSG